MSRTDRLQPSRTIVLVGLMGAGKTNIGRRLAQRLGIAFVDADKPSTQKYFDLLWPKVRVGGMIITDNAATHRVELADFVKSVRSRPDSHSIEIAIGNGIEWTVKIT